MAHENATSAFFLFTLLIHNLMYCKNTHSMGMRKINVL